MKRQKLIENLENILAELKNSGKENDNIVIWACDHCCDDINWIVMDGKFELDEKNNLNIL